MISSLTSGRHEQLRLLSSSCSPHGNNVPVQSTHAFSPISIRRYVGPTYIVFFGYSTLALLIDSFRGWNQPIGNLLSWHRQRHPLGRRAAVLHLEKYPFQPRNVIKWDGKLELLAQSNRTSLAVDNNPSECDVDLRKAVYPFGPFPSANSLVNATIGSKTRDGMGVRAF